MNWLQRLAAQFYNEDFIDEYGNALGSDGDIGDYNHDMRAMEHIIYSSLDNAEDIYSLDPDDLDDESLAVIESNFPGFTELVWSGRYLPKEFAVMKMGWIRVIGDNFEVEKVDENVLRRIVDYVYDHMDGDLEDLTIYINERSTGKYVPMNFLELAEAVQSGQGTMKFYMLSRRPSGLY